MRGKPSSGALADAAGGITPADAGKTNKQNSRYFFPQDHPRGCGENYNTYNYQRKQTGSPPRMRGKPGITVEGGCPARITPADAGKTFLIPLSRGYLKDHPRGCGENKAKLLI